MLSGPLSGVALADRDAPRPCAPVPSLDWNRAIPPDSQCHVKGSIKDGSFVANPLCALCMARAPCSAAREGRRPSPAVQAKRLRLVRCEGGERAPCPVVRQ